MKNIGKKEEISTKENDCRGRKNKGQKKQETGDGWEGKKRVGRKETGGKEKGKKRVGRKETGGKEKGKKRVGRKKERNGWEGKKREITMWQRPISQHKISITFRRRTNKNKCKNNIN